MKAAFTLLLVGLAACQHTSAEEARRVSASDRACFARDSINRPAPMLVYSSVTVADETGDMSGLEFSFLPTADGWQGWSREAAGELGLLHALAEVRIDTATRRASFTIPNGPDSSAFTGSISCDSLWGAFQAYRGTPEIPVTYRRIR